MAKHPNRPWWADWLVELAPDIRALATLGMFALVAYDMWLIATIPAIGDNELFKTVSTLLLGSGAFGLVCAFLWGGSKATASAVETVNAMARTAPPAGAPGAVTVSAPSPADITVSQPGAPAP